MEFALRKTIRGHMPRIQFGKIAAQILGSKYSLSVVLCGDTLSRRLNTQYRKKTYKPNVLSFPLSTTEGEIFLNIRKAEREAQGEGITPEKRIAFLFIHACLHLKGLDHGDKMDAQEIKYLKKSGF